MSSKALQKASMKAKELRALLPASLPSDLPAFAPSMIEGMRQQLAELITYLDESFMQESLAEEGRGFDAESVEHFLQLARRGKNRGASGGEVRCFNLASALRKHLDDCCGVDYDAITGFCELMRATGGGYETVENLLRGMDGRRR